MNLKMRSMVFEDSLFEECYFEDITSSNTFFKNCTFIATLFYNTGERAQFCLLCLSVKMTQFRIPPIPPQKKNATSPGNSRLNPPISETLLIFFSLSPPVKMREKMPESSDSFTPLSHVPIVQQQGRGRAAAFVIEMLRLHLNSCSPR